MTEQKGISERIKELQKLSESEKRNDEDQAKKIAEEKEKREKAEIERNRLNKEWEEKDRKKKLEAKINKYTLVTCILLAIITAVVFVIYFGFKPAFEAPETLMAILFIISCFIPPFFLISIPAVLLIFLLCYALIPMLIGGFTFIVLYFPAYIIFSLFLK